MFFPLIVVFSFFPPLVLVPLLPNFTVTFPFYFISSNKEGSPPPPHPPPPIPHFIGDPHFNFSPPLSCFTSISLLELMIHSLSSLSSDVITLTFLYLFPPLLCLDLFSLCFLSRVLILLFSVIPPLLPIF